jgi:hypothetical protein
VNTYTLINKAGERFFVKFHFDPELGVHSLTWDEGDFTTAERFIYSLTICQQPRSLVDRTLTSIAKISKRLSTAVPLQSGPFQSKLSPWTRRMALISSEFILYEVTTND